MLYFYDKNLRCWDSEDSYIRHGRFADHYPPLSEEKINDLKNARKNKKFLIVENREGRTKRPFFPGINCDLLYFDIEDIKLLIQGKSDQEIIVYYSGCSSSSRACIKLSDIKNTSILKDFKDDLSYVVNFVEDVSYLGQENDSLKNIVIHNNYWSLCSESQLYYQMEGNRLDLI